MCSTFQLGKWTAGFGRDYTKRNNFSVAGLDKLYKKRYGVTRSEMNLGFLGKLSRDIRILEVGANIGNQLLALQKLGFSDLWGVEPLLYAVEIGKKRLLDANLIKGSIFEIPFKENFFDLVFTSGVLIHIQPDHLIKGLKEIYRCSRRYIWGFEYFSEKQEKINYRGNKNLLWKANYPEIYLENFPNLKLIKREYFQYNDEKNKDVMFILEKVK